MKIIKIIFVLNLFILFSLQSLLACICEKPLPPPCYNYWQYEAVFVGTVKEIKSDESSYRNKIQVVVDKNYKGINSDVVFTETGGTSCDFEAYKENKKFLIYGNLYKDDKTYFTTSYCSPSRIYEEDLIDLEFLNALNNSTPFYWIWGTMSKKSDEYYFGHQPLQGVQAQVFYNKKKLVGVSNENGDLKISVAKKGIYKVRVFPPKETMIDGNKLVNSYFKDKLETLKSHNFNKKNHYLEYTVEVKANECGWFYLPLQNYEKE